MFRVETWILVLGFTGQALFFMRFLVQWLYSEKHKKSVIPVSFWYFSIGGSTLLLAYAIIRKDPVFIVGQGMGFLIICTTTTTLCNHFIFLKPEHPMKIISLVMNLSNFW